MDHVITVRGVDFELSADAFTRLQGATEDWDANDVFDGFAAHVPPAYRGDVWLAVGSPPPPSHVLRYDGPSSVSFVTFTDCGDGSVRVDCSDGYGTPFTESRDAARARWDGMIGRGWIYEKKPE